MVFDRSQTITRCQWRNDGTVPTLGTRSVACCLNFFLPFYIFAVALCCASTSKLSVSGHSRHAFGKGAGAWRDCGSFWASWLCRPWRNEQLQSEALPWQLHAHFRHWQHICHGHFEQFGLSLGLREYIAFRIPLGIATLAGWITPLEKRRLAS